MRLSQVAARSGVPLDQIASLLTVWETDPCATVKARLRPLPGDQPDRVDAAIDAVSRVGDLAVAEQECRPS